MSIKHDMLQAEHKTVNPEEIEVAFQHVMHQIQSLLHNIKY
jgi:hypothetical protein